MQRTNIIQNALQKMRQSFSKMGGSRNWCFTLNNYNEDQITAIVALENEDLVSYCVFGKEIGDTGTKHLQGYICFTKRMLLKGVKDYIGGNPHVEVARHPQKAADYCKKDGDFIEFGEPPAAASGKRNDLEEFKSDVKNGVLDPKELREKHSLVMGRYPNFARAYVLDNTPALEFEMFPLREWQMALNQKLNREPDSRTIIFIVDTNGNQGKSWFAHYYKRMHEKVQILLPGKKADMAFSVDPNNRVLFLDAPRSKQGDYIQYDFLEDVKNQYVFSPKYESYHKNMRKSHVVVLMNEQPDMHKLSIDRYDITTL